MSQRPTLEIHVPISPTPLFANMVHALVRSLRRFGGAYSAAPVVVTIGDAQVDPSFEAAHPWMRQLGVEVRWLDPELFARHSFYATAVERFRHATTADMLLHLDADVLIAAPLDPLIELCWEQKALGGLIAHAAPFKKNEEWQQLYDALGLGQVLAPYEHTGWGYMRTDPSVRFTPPYFNLGVLAMHASVSRRLGEVVYELMAQVDRVVDTFFKCQIAVSLAVVREHLPYVCLPMRYNFANDPLLEALHASELPHLTILHLLRDHQGVDKQRVFASLGAMEALAAREDLKVVNLRARDVLREVLPLIRADRGLA